MPVTVDQRELARLGAHARLLQIDKERSALLRAFPGIHREADREARWVGGGSQKRKLSPAARKRLSAAMRMYWVKKKAKLARRQA